MENPYLPEEMIRSILARLPSITLIEWRLVCKSWSVMIKDGAFIRLHLSSHQLSRSHHHHLFPPKKRLSDRFKYGLLMSHPNPSDTIWWHSRRFKWSRFEPGCLENSWWVLGSVPAAGLVLAKIAGNLFLFNPCIGKFKKIPPPPHPIPPIYMFGFGIDPSSGDYKVVEIDAHNHTHMYSSSSGSWRKLVDVAPSEKYRAVVYGYYFRRSNDPSISSRYGHNSDSSISLDGVIYWLVTSRETEYSSSVSPNLMKILSFDIARERFQIIELPHDVTPEFHMGHIKPLIFVYEERVSLFIIWAGENRRWYFRTWSMDSNKAREGQPNDIDNYPWSAKCHFALPEKLKGKPLGLISSGEVLVSGNNGMLSLYDPETDVLKKAGRQLSPQCCYYSLADSLLLLN